MATEEEEKLLSYCFKTVGEMEEERENEKYWEMIEKVFDKIFEKKISKKEKDWTEVWSYVNEELKSMSFCELQHRPTKMFICYNRDWVSGSCVECRKKGNHHQLLDPREARLLYRPVVEQQYMWEPYGIKLRGRRPPKEEAGNYAHGHNLSLSLRL